MMRSNTREKGPSTITVQANEPLPVEVVNQKKNRAPYNLSMALNPSDPRHLGPADGICFFGGDLPFLLVHSDNQVFRIERGQYLPTNGKNVAIENPHDRIGDAYVTMNATTPSGSNDDASQAHNKYFGRSNILTTQSIGGSLIFPTSNNRLKLQFKTNSAVLVTLIPNAREEFADLAEDGVLTEFDMVHPSGKILDLARSFKIDCTWGQRTNWLSAAGITDSNVFEVEEGVTSGEYRLYEGTAVFLTRYGMDQRTICNLRIFDEGRETSAAVV